MADISDKLTYLNETKGLIKKGLNDLGADLTDASSFRSYANVLSGMYDDYPKVTGEGVDLSLSPTKQGKLAITPKGSSSQFSTSGKNLLNNSITEPTTSGGVTLTPVFDENGLLDYYLANGTVTSSSNVFIQTGKYSGINNANYIVNGFTDATNLRFRVWKGTSYTDVASNETAITTASEGENFGLQIRFTTGATYNNVKIQPMIRLATITDDTYEPYTNGVAPNPDYPQDVKSVEEDNEMWINNRNLFDYSNISWMYFPSGLTVTKNISEFTINGTNTGTECRLIGGWNNNNPSYKLPYGSYKIYAYLDGVSLTREIGLGNGTSHKSAPVTNFTIDAEYPGLSTLLVRIPADTYVDAKLQVIILKVDETDLTFEQPQSQKYSLNLGVNNLWKPIPSDTKNGVTLTYNDDGSYVLNGTATANSSFYVSVNYPGSKTYTLSANNDETITSSNYLLLETTGGSSERITMTLTHKNETKTFTNTNDLTTLVFVIASGTTFNNFTMKPQLELGSVAHSFSKYGIDPIELNSSPDGTVRDAIVGSSAISYNLFDGELEYGQLNQNDGTPQGSATDRKRTKNFINVENLNEVTLSFDIITAVSAYGRFFLYDKDYNMLSNSQIASNTKTINVENAYYVKWFIGENANYDTLMLTEGSEAKPYFPYGQVGMWCKREYIGKVVLDGSENWQQSGYTNETIYSAYNQLYDYKQNSVFISNLFTYVSNVDGTTSVEYISTGGDSIRIGVFKSRLTAYTINDFKNWLSENNVTVWYQKAQYTDIPITDITLINQLNDLYDNGRSYDGTTNITSTYENGNEQMVIYAEALMDISDSTKVKINEENLTNIANTLRTRNRTTALYTPAQMPAAIETIGDMGDISNGIIQEYLTTADTIDANTFVEFVNTNDYTLSADTELSSSYYSYAYARAVKLSDNKVFIVHNSNTDTMGLNGMVCEINGDTITHGADTVLSAEYASSSFASPVAIDENTVFISHSAGGDNPGLNGIVCTISGLVITPGTDTVLVSTVNSYYSSYATPIFETRAGWVLVTHMSDENNYYLNGIICHISGTTITHNTDTTLLSTMGSYTNAKAVEIMGGEVFIAHPKGTKLNGFICSVSTINGGDLYPYADTEINATSGSWNNSNLLKLDSSRVLITHANNNDNAYLNAIVCGVSGGVITPGTDAQLEAATGASNGSYPVLLEEDKVFIAHGDSYFDGRLKAAICTISGTTITLVLNDVIDSDVSSINEVNPVVLDDTTVFISHCTGGDGHYMSLTLSGLIYKIAKKIKIAEDSIDGMTKEECSPTTAGDVWVLEPYVEVNPEDLM